LGSWRYDGYKPEHFISKIIETLKSRNIKEIPGDLVIDDTYFDFQKIPGGWPYNDIGNYYGAGVWGVNWRENQFDINTFGKDFKNFNINLEGVHFVNDARTEGTSDRSIIFTTPYNDIGNYYGAGVWGVNWRENQFDINTFGKDFKNFNINLEGVHFVNDARTEGTSDRSIIFTTPYNDVAHITGTLPAKNITISGATPNPPKQLALEIVAELKKQNIAFNGKIIINSERLIEGQNPLVFPKNKVILEYLSPTLDKMVFWFLKKSINFYGETFVKTMAKEKTGNSSFESGMKYLKNFWKQRGIDERMINFVDGSGLSPQNYASTRAEVLALIWAKKQPWFAEYFEGFPVQGNGMKMKSGSIKDCRAFAGYHTSKSGQKYVFAIIMNNYQANDLSDALYKVLNHLK
jgi:D-alanyl-D-alanine carboxypeptidase/D-alanyl-D-alanine-endopeptidase (penicillin-binding protein 4)